MTHIRFGLVAAVALLSGIAAYVRRTTDRNDVLETSHVFDFSMDRVIDV
ncbi:MAG TPA: hypothetical protein VGM90_36100 [Kofleriaceae bacterium]|jgi:hypothetical protein